MKTFIEARDGTPLYFKDWGTGSPVVFVHSWALTNEVWQYQHEHLVEAGHRVIAFDRRGHGRSGQPGSGYDLDTLAGDLAAVMAALEVDGATLVGHSMGCAEVVRYVARSGAQRVARIALVAPTTPMLLRAPDNPDGIDASFFVALRGRWRQDFPGWIAENARPFFSADTSQAMLEWGSSMMQQIPLKVAIDTQRSMVDADVRPDLKLIRLPALVVHGTADASAPYHLTGQATAALLPHCSFKTYEGAPHGLLLTHRERLNADLGEFVGARP